MNILVKDNIENPAILGESFVEIAVENRKKEMQRMRSYGKKNG